MSYVEIHFKDNGIILSKVTRLTFDLSFDEAIVYAEKIFTPTIRSIYVNDKKSDKLIKIEQINNQLVKSFVLDLFDFKENFQ